jgi:hypothetical protein
VAWGHLLLLSHHWPESTFLAILRFHTTDTEETLVKQPSDDIQTSSKPISKPRKAKRGETTRNKTADEPKTKLCEIRTREIV